mmetsp:Transcript_26529/g.42526  ORF Transcript_26529/g.42526 Transcript_26529/m.42526 type:complete len:216 (+) Transcript_26529:129-776(+)
MYTLLVWCVYLTIEGSLAALPRFGGGHDELHDRLHQPRDGSHPPHYGAHAGQELARRVPVLLVVHPDRTELVVEVYAAGARSPVHQPCSLGRRLRHAVLVCAHCHPSELSEGCRHHLEEVLVDGVRGQLAVVSVERADKARKSVAKRELVDGVSHVELGTHVELDVRETDLQALSGGHREASGHAIHLEVPDHLAPLFIPVLKRLLYAVGKLLSQ